MVASSYSPKKPSVRNRSGWLISGNLLLCILIVLSLLMEFPGSERPRTDDYDCNKAHSSKYGLDGPWLPTSIVLVNMMMS